MLVLPNNTLQHKLHTLMGECWLEYDSTRLYTLLVQVLTKTHTTAHDAHTNVQVLAEYGSTTLHTSCTHHWC